MTPKEFEDYVIGLDLLKQHITLGVEKINSIPEEAEFATMNSRGWTLWYDEGNEDWYITTEIPGVQGKYKMKLKDR